MTKTSVYGIVRTRVDAEELVEALLAEGFAEHEVAVRLPRTPSTKAGGGATASSGTTFAAGLAVATGTVVGLLGGMGLGVLVIPSLGPLLAAGPLVTMLAGAAVGMTVGSIAGGLVALAIPETHVVEHEEALEPRSIIVSVQTHDTDRARRAHAIFTVTGAADVSTTRDASTARWLAAGEDRLEAQERAYGWSSRSGER